MVLNSKMNQKYQTCHFFKKTLKQAGAELGQAQVKLDAIIEVIVEDGVEVVKLSSIIILGRWVGGWVGGQIN